MWFIYLALAIFSALISANNVNAAITEVIVYPSGALIKEERAITLNKGENTLEWGNLGQQVELDSLRVELPEGARLIDREVQTVQTSQENNAQRAALEAALQEAKKKLESVNDHLDLIRKNENYLEQIQQASTTPVKGEAAYQFGAPAQWNEMMSFVRDNRQKLQSERRATEQEQTLAMKEVQKIQRQINDLNSTPTLYSQKLNLKVESLKAQQSNASISYFDPGASWRPTYQVWVDPNKKSVQLTYGAFIRQNTSTSWENVVLTLSTARPQMNTTPPELIPWWVREYRPVTPVRYKNAIMGDAAGAKEMRMDMAAAPAMEEANFAPVTAVQNLTFVEFKIPGKNTIPMDNQEHRFVITDLPLKGELTYKIIPELSADVYLQTKVTNTSDFTLLAGESQLYSGGNFVGKGYLKDVQPGESFELNLGADPAIKVERKLLSRKTDITGLMNDNERVTFSYAIEIKNLKKTAQNIKLTERLPISQHEKIKVELVEPKELAKLVDKEGKLTWDFNMAAGETKKITLTYWVEHPKNMRVEGI